MIADVHFPSLRPRTGDGPPGHKSTRGVEFRTQRLSNRGSRDRGPSLSVSRVVKDLRASFDRRAAAESPPRASRGPATWPGEPFAGSKSEPYVPQRLGRPTAGSAFRRNQGTKADHRSIRAGTSAAVGGSFSKFAEQFPHDRALNRFNICSHGETFFVVRHPICTDSTKLVSITNAVVRRRHP
jgi:hypothetical protein